jgi:hypothetical protein
MKKIVAISVAIGILFVLAGCDVQPQAPPSLIVAKESVTHHPDIIVLRVHLKITTVAQPQKYTADVALYQYFRIKRKQIPIPIAAWHRNLADIPPVGETLTWIFPDALPPHSEARVVCHPGQFFVRWRIKGVTSEGTPEDVTFFYPYDIEKEKYKAMPSPKRSWQVNCKRFGVVPDPHGE